MWMAAMLFLDLRYGHAFQVSEASGALLLIMLGKVSLNLVLLRTRRQNMRESFMGHFCISLAAFDSLLLVTMAFISFFQDFMIWGIRFSKYHICLLAQIMALAYGILHYPVCFLAGLDYYFTITQVSKSNVCRRYLYTVTVIVTWISVLCYVLSLPGDSIGLNVLHYNSADWCPFYISSQSYWLSLSILSVLGLVLVLCWSEVVIMLQSIKLASFKCETVFFFSYGPDCSPRDCARHLLTRLLICFNGTWAAFVLLQTFIVSFGAQIPAYVEMNVPWLYFVNSFLIAIAYWARRHRLEMTEETWDLDPFVSWKFCFVPFEYQYADDTRKLTTSIVAC